MKNHVIKILVSILLLPTAALASDVEGESVKLLELTGVTERHSAIANVMVAKFKLNRKESKQLKKDINSKTSKLYTETFTHDELVALNEFFSSELGKTYIAKEKSINEKFQNEVMTPIMTNYIK